MVAFCSHFLHLWPQTDVFVTYSGDVFISPALLRVYTHLLLAKSDFILWLSCEAAGPVPLDGICAFRTC